MDEQENIDINAKGYEFVSKLRTEKIVKREVPQELSGSLKERGSVDWSDKVDTSKRSTSKSLDYAGRVTGIDGVVNGDNVGFDELNYPEFKRVITFAQNEYFSDIASYEFIEDQAFEWCLQVHENSRATVDILTFIEAKIHENIEAYTFYFPIDNLSIEFPFIVGNTQFCYLTKAEMDNYYHQLLSKEGSTWNEESFDNIYRKDFQGIVLAKVIVNSERRLAEDLAKEAAVLSIDVLRIHTETLAIPDFKVTFDLTFRLNYQRMSKFLTGKGLDHTGYALNMQFNTVDYSWTEEHTRLNAERSMNLFSHFITQRKKKNELYNLIIQAIHSFGTALADVDLHSRSISLITILESLLLKYEEQYKMEHKAKQRAVKLASLSVQEDEEIREFLSTIYQVRHKMVHKAVRLEIGHIALGKVQTTIFVAIMKLIMLNNTYSSKNDFIDYIDSVERVDGKNRPATNL